MDPLVSIIFHIGMGLMFFQNVLILSRKQPTLTLKLLLLIMLQLMAAEIG